jgi:CO/xanthine dehydrogenase Mo-binding subunit
VEVDLETGRVRPLDVVVALNIGTVVNPRLAGLQVEGSATFAIGQALFEEARIDEGGHISNRTLSEYQLPAMSDMPARLGVDFHEPSGSHEIHGVGETALPPVRAAIANAVSRAIGRTVLELPMTPEAVLRALEVEPQAGSTS